MDLEKGDVWPTSLNLKQRDLRRRRGICLDLGKVNGGLSRDKWWNVMEESEADNPSNKCVKSYYEGVE